MKAKLRTPDEKEAVAVFLTANGAAQVAADGTDNEELRDIESANYINKRAKKQLPYRSLVHISNEVERLFSATGIIMRPYWRLMDPISLNACHAPSQERPLG